MECVYYAVRNGSLCTFRFHYNRQRVTETGVIMARKCGWSFVHFVAGKH